jgi:methylthioribose-1-phosphate isomerase
MFNSIIFDAASRSLQIIDQTCLPHEYRVLTLHTIEQCCNAIKTMQVRGAPLIGITAAFGFSFGLRENNSDQAVENLFNDLMATRPTAINLYWALTKIKNEIKKVKEADRYSVALRTSITMLEEDIATCSKMGDQGLDLLRRVFMRARSKTLNIMTHCNAGWLATAGWGTALAPVYKAQEATIPVHVWVSETRPRNQGAELTAWELERAGVPCTVIPDNAAGHLMQTGKVDLCIVGSDRTTASGDVCNKIGTYLKALAASASQIPFYVALPTSTIDWQLQDGLSGIPIEQRSPAEVTSIRGKAEDGRLVRVQLTTDNSKAVNYAFDVTPAKLVTGLITEYGVYKATEEDLSRLKKQINC